MADFPRWNSTVASIEGEIALGQKLKLEVPNVERTFTPKVVEFEPARRMLWSDGFAPMFSGKRSFALEEKPDGSTDFTMIEVFSGLMLPLIRGSLPDFHRASSNTPRTSRRRRSAEAELVAHPAHSRTENPPKTVHPACVRSSIHRLHPYG